ncbi:MAG: luciferase-like [Alphaproteobacteria bacterium]|nr:luciferase-like [Alphaproteobacteria bacterium]
MRYSVGFPTGMEGLIYPIPFAETNDLLKIAQTAEKHGFDSLWGNDHMTTQDYVREEFPVPPRFWEVLTTSAWLAGQTTKLRFGTGLLVLPMRRDIVVTAKQIATLDQLSGGRVEIGIGVGAYREEFEAVQPNVKAHRGDMVEEGIQALRKLFTERSSSFDGKYYQFKNVEFAPKPKQARLPLLIGGNNINAIRRAALHGDGWIPAGFHTDKIAEGVKQMHEIATVNGRDAKSLQVAPQFICHVGKDHEKAIARFRQSQMHTHLVSLSKSTLKEQGSLTHEDINLIGAPDAILAKIAKAKAAGATHLLGILFAANDVPELLDQMQIFAETVVPHIK